MRLAHAATAKVGADAQRAVVGATVGVAVGALVPVSRRGLLDLKAAGASDTCAWTAEVHFKPKTRRGARSARTSAPMPPSVVFALLSRAELFNIEKQKPSI